MERETRLIYFDEAEHKYTDSFGNVYTSMTTLISKYHEGFKAKEIAQACEKIGRNPNHKSYQKYKNKTAKQLLHEWDITRIEACKKGTRKHNYLEDTIKKHNGYYRNNSTYINGRIYTIDDIASNPNIGSIELSYFKDNDINTKYPTIYNTLVELVSLGFKLYSEIAVYDSNLLISGLIDLLAVKDKNFIIIDWKTNQSPIMFESGYFKKDNNNVITDEYITKDDNFDYPLRHLNDSVGVKYSMQLSGYASLVESWGYTNLGNMLFHIRDINDEEVVTPVSTLDLKKDFRLMANHHYNSNIRELKFQSKLFN